MKFLKQVRDLGMNLFNEELVTPSNFSTFVLILASSVIVKICRGFTHLHIKLWKCCARSIEKLCCIFCFSFETVQDCELSHVLDEFSKIIRNMMYLKKRLHQAQH